MAHMKGVGRGKVALTLRGREETEGKQSKGIRRGSAALTLGGAGRNRGENIAATGAVEGSLTRGNSLDTAGAGRSREENISTNDAIEGSSTRGGSLHTAGEERNRRGGAVQGAVQEEAGDVVVVEREGTPAAMPEMLQLALCTLCSEPLLDVCVLPCPHSFCRLCWTDYVEAKGTT